jgi:hypothetical protein
MAVLSFVASSPSLYWFKQNPHFWRKFMTVTCDTAPWFCNEKLCIQNIYLHERCIMKKLVTHHRNNYSYKQLVVIMFEWPDYLLVKRLENVAAVWRKNLNVYTLQLTWVLGISSTMVMKSKMFPFLELILASNVISKCNLISAWNLQPFIINFNHKIKLLV